MKAFLRGYGYLLISLLVYSAPGAQQLPVTLYSSREGDPQAGATAIYQDKKGWIWFVNGYDVVQYDGHRFKSFPPSRRTKYNYVFGLMEVQDEKWVLGYPDPMRINGIR